MSKDKIDAFSKRLSTITGDGKTQTVFAATVLLLRDGESGMETLMLRKNSKIAFGGMWVFPGGRIDDDDGAENAPMEDRARHAAAREAMEEVELKVAAEDMAWFSHWTPPELGNRRFITWFFAAPAPEGVVTIDDGEIKESQWLSPADALVKHRAGDIEIVPPTYVTLHYLSAYTSVEEAMVALEQVEPRHYATHIGASGDDLVAMWEGDAGYESGEADTQGARHRLRMASGGWVLEDSGAVADS
jgi:8-oxo-dGTP pyrophosphatase MutT (NUDIX family)